MSKMVFAEPPQAETPIVRKPSPVPLSGWGANHVAPGFLVAPEVPEEFFRYVEQKGSIARGLGRSYGDAAINDQRRVIDVKKANRILAFDENTGLLTCEAGLSLADILRIFTPRGWFPLVTPGTKYVTVGGCIANDIHGKAHHSQGCFSEGVKDITMLMYDGSVVTFDRESQPDLFWSTVAGVGLLGIILSATIALRRVETSYFRQQALQVEDLPELLSALDEQDQHFTYSVATLDVFAPRSRLGRGVLTLGEHARLDELPAQFAKNPLSVSGPPKLNVPFTLPELTLNSLSMRIINSVILTIMKSGAAIGHYEGFFYPLDKIDNWNRGYGRRGFTQYQFVIPPDEGEKRLRPILETIMSSGQLPFLNILKKMGRENAAPLSFPREGYTFAIDFPIRKDTPALLRRLDDMVVDAGGRVYLAKDSYLDAAMVPRMYPRLDEWRAAKEKYDPHNVFSSNLGRRLGLS